MSMSRLWQKTLWRTSLRLSSSISCFCEKVGRIIDLPLWSKKDFRWPHLTKAPFEKDSTSGKKNSNPFLYPMRFQYVQNTYYVFGSTFDETFFRSFRRGFLPWDVCFEKPQTQQNVPADIHWFWYIQSLRRKCSVKELRTIKQWKTATFTMGNF